MLQKEELQSSLLLIAAFLGCGLLHTVLYAVPFATEIVRIVCGVAALMWAHDIRERILDRRLRRLLVGVSSLFTLLFFLQVCNYHAFNGEIAINRHIEYAYYLPLTLIPLLVFLVALYLNVQEDERISPFWHWLWLPGLLLIGLFLTNDLHHWVFSFPSGRMRTDYSHHLLVYWLFVVWAVSLVGASLALFIHKCRLPKRSIQMMIPLLPIGLGVMLLLAMLFGLTPRIRGVQVWHMGEIYGFMGFGFLEACIHTGLIPSNQHYRRVFSLLRIPARIETTQGEVLYATASPFQEDEDLQLHTTQIRGGQVSWLVDLRKLHQLDRALEQTVEQLESRHSLLREEATIRQEKEQHDTRSRLYSHIALAVQPELDAMEQLLSTHPEADSDTLARIAVLNAYIKRRGNLELMAEDAEQISTRELMLAISESLIYAALCGIETYADCSQEYIVHAPHIIDAYSQ